MPFTKHGELDLVEHLISEHGAMTLNDEQLDGHEDHLVPKECLIETDRQ
jgi:hypothetical protein